MIREALIRTPIKGDKEALDWSFDGDEGEGPVGWGRSQGTRWRGEGERETVQGELEWGGVEGRWGGEKGG